MSDLVKTNAWESAQAYQNSSSTQASKSVGTFFRNY
jgi:hypothetical protein